VALIESYRSIERAQGADAPATIEARVATERMVRESQGFIASFIASARSLRWKIHMDARKNAAEVLGQVAAYEAAPELYQERRVMEILREVLQTVRSKYVLAVDPSRTDLDIEMQEPDAGLNLRDYLENPAEGN
jgi:hypothetical protein